MSRITLFIITTLLFTGTACNKQENGADAYGNFEATEVLVSAEANGKLKEFIVLEGEEFSSGERIGLVDTIPLYLKKKQLQARIEALNTKTINIPSQINVLIERKNVVEREKRRLENLFRDGAATQKQLDDINGEINVINRELQANRERLETNNAGLLSEIMPIRWQIEEINDQINRSVLLNPVTGIVLTKFAEEHEVVNYGKPLYNIADLSTLYLRAYVSGMDLSDIAIGQTVRVFIDDGKDTLKEFEGTISWISEKAEFTPKIVQTKDERVNLVYAVKIRVKNDGSIKIGMPGEVKFD